MDCSHVNFSQVEKEGQTADFSFPCHGSLPSLQGALCAYASTPTYLYSFGQVGHSQRVLRCLDCLCTIMRSHLTKVKLLKNVWEKGQRRVNNIRSLFSAGLLRWLQGACVYPAAFAGAVGAVSKTFLLHVWQICRAARRGLRPVVCSQPPSMSDKAPGLSIQERGNKQSMGCMCMRVCVF